MNNNDITISNPLDAFGRVRVSNPFTLFDFNSILGINRLLFNIYKVGAGTATNIDSSVDLAVTAGQSFTITSKESIPYQPGKSKLIFLTGVLYTDEFDLDNLSSKIGCFNDNNGIFIECLNGNIRVCVRKNGVVTESRNRCQWIDPLNGTGESCISIDFSKAQIFAWDIEWLGVGQVRCGIIYEGKFVPYYVFDHFNQIISPYTLYAKLPIRYEIISTGSTNSMRMICGSVISEGGFSPIGNPFTYTNYSTSGLTISGSTFRPVLGIKLQIGGLLPYNNTTIKVKTVDIFNTTANNYGSWKLLLNPVITWGAGNPGWVSFPNVIEVVTENENGSAELSIPSDAQSAAATISGGKTIAAGVFSTRENSILFTGIEEMLQMPGIGLQSSGQSEEIFLVANDLGAGNSTLLVSFSWIEYS